MASIGIRQHAHGEAAALAGPSGGSFHNTGRTAAVEQHPPLLGDQAPQTVGLGFLNRIGAPPSHDADDDSGRYRCHFCFCTYIRLSTAEL